VIGPSFASTLPSNLSATWSYLGVDSDQPFARTNAAVAFDPGQGLGLLFGGKDASGTFLNDTYVNDGDFPGKWAESPNALLQSPPALANAGLVYDSGLRGFLLFGGELANGSAYGGTWEFANFAWTDLSANLSLAPPSSAWPAMAYDPLTRTTVLLVSTQPGVMWTFGSGRWSSVLLGPTSPPTSSPSLVWDDALGSLVLFGGAASGTGSQGLDATWIYNAGGWQQSNGTTAPSAEVHPPMAFDPRIPGVLLLSEGGASPTWTFTSSGWAASSMTAAPFDRSGSMLYYDSNTAFDILFGGAEPNATVPGDEWGWSVPPPYSDPTLEAAPIGVTTWIEVAAVIAIPVAAALILRRRPPRKLPTDAPAAAPSAAAA
jgi:hypothetical protein